MNTHSALHARRPLPALALAAMLACGNTPVLAAPGAHGPNGEHLDGPTAVQVVSALPRLQAQTEVFELVAELRTSELVMLVDRYDTNEPVLGATLEVESGPLKAEAAFRPEQGDYVVTDAEMLKALAAPGEHALVFTLVAGQDSDLLDGTLVAAADPKAAASARGEHGHAHGAGDHGHSGHGQGEHHHELERAAWIGAGVAALGLIGGIAWWRQRRGQAGKLQGGL